MGMGRVEETLTWEEDVTRMHADTTLIDAARHTVPVIREYHAEAERARRLSPTVWAALHDAGVLRLCTPRSLGGLDVDPITRALVIEEISGHDAAAGWTLANPLDHKPRQNIIYTSAE
jgi:indole-3-acetate monooxygenase